MNALNVNSDVKKPIGFMHVLPEEEFTCSKHGAYRGSPCIIFKSKHTPDCPLCAAESEKAEREADILSRQKQEIERFKAMNIGKRYWNESFDTFNPYTDELKHILEIAKTFVESASSGKLVMLGEHGNGKTHLAVSALKVTGGIIHTAFEIGVLLRQSYGGDTQEWKVLQNLSDTPLLVIDEVEKIKGSAWDHNWLSCVVNRRHENMLPTIFISNCHLKDDCPQSGCKNCIESNLESDVLSRITEDGIVLKFNSPDYRVTKRGLNRTF